MKKAIITGVTGQDGSYLAELLLSKGYEVHGIRRRSSYPTTSRIDHIIDNPMYSDLFHLHYGDLTDSVSLSRIINNVLPDEFYNLAAQSHVHVSFDSPEYTANADAIGTLRILELIKQVKHKKDIKFYQASTSELYGLIQEKIQSESTPFYPRSPYGVAKLYGYWIAVNYREAYDIFAVNGILFNHESPRRGDTFVTRKITIGISRILKNKQAVLNLGNIYAERDWGHAKDYVEAMWLMLQAEKPKDYVVATGKKYSVKTFIIKAFEIVGIKLQWKGELENEKAFITDIDYEKINNLGLNGTQVNIGQCVVQIDPYYYRPTEVEVLIGDSSSIQKDLKWEPKSNFNDLVLEMVMSDLNEI